MRASHAALAILGAWLTHWTAYVLPLVNLGPVAVPGFALAAVAGALLLLVLVVWLMAIRPVLRHPPGSRGVMA